MMESDAVYSVFPVRGGYAALTGKNGQITGFVLPEKKRRKAEKAALALFPDARNSSPAFMRLAVKRIIRYFNGNRENFSGIRICFEGIPDFGVKVLKAARKVPYGTVISYGKLAALAGSPRASRAVGSALAVNPVPVLIPCHRIIRSDRSIGGFSAGIKWKKTLLKIERGGKNAKSKKENDSQ